MTRPAWYAHSASVDGQPWQRLSVHLEGTAERAAAFLAAAGLAEWGRAAGLLHDVGKYADQFQARLEGSRRPFDHSAPAQGSQSRGIERLNRVLSEAGLCAAFYSDRLGRPSLRPPHGD